MWHFVRWCVVVMAVCSTASASAADFFFKDGDVVVMIGDSITEQHLYSNYVEMWTVTRFPKWKLTFRNVGIGGDAVHPGPPGQALMAASILKGLSFPSLVSSAEIDATGGKVVAAKNCTVENVAAKDGGLSFSRLDGALPFFPADAVSILPHAPILEELNDYRLKVTDLAAGKYEIRVGGKKIVELTAEQLATGANLASGALTDGPIADQANAVKAAVEAKNRFHHDMIFRGIVLSNVPDWVYSVVPREELEAKKKTVIEDRLAKLRALDAEVAKVLVLKANTFDIVPVK